MSSSSSSSSSLALAEIRSRYDQSPSNWEAVYLGEECHLMAYPPYCEGDKTAIRETYAIIPGIEQEAIAFLSNAHPYVGFLLDLVDRGIRRGREMEHELAAKSGTNTEDTKPRNYAAQCAIKCGEPAFKKFLKERHGLGTATNDATAAKIRELCGLASRRQLNTDPEKAEIWRRLLREFDAWKRNREGRNVT